MTSLEEKAAALKAGTKRSKKPPWVQPTLDDLAYGTVLAFDQTITKTGFCLLSHRPSGLVVHDRGKMVEVAVPDLKGFADTLQRATWMAQRIRNLILSGKAEHTTMVVVHEMPAVVGHRLESSQMAALGVSLACEERYVPRVMVSKQHVAAVLCPPDDRYGKPAITRATCQFLDTKGRDWNQDSRDALALALTYLYDRKQAS